MFKKTTSPSPVASSSAGTPEHGHNPYLDARREWDERYGDALARASNWRRAAFAALAVALVAVVGIAHIGAQSKIEPYVIGRGRSRRHAEGDRRAHAPQGDDIGLDLALRPDVSDAHYGNERDGECGKRRTLPVPRARERIPITLIPFAPRIEIGVMPMLGGPRRR